ncbi:MAG: hypothetical protein QOG31_680, partial [Thermoplasmata archaeon]|nr:hypothetical protein [Thermoplasmata archaeon]
MLNRALIAIAAVALLLPLPAAGWRPDTHEQVTAVSVAVADRAFGGYLGTLKADGTDGQGISVPTGSCGKSVPESIYGTTAADVLLKNIGTPDDGSLDPELTLPVAAKHLASQLAPVRWGFGLANWFGWCSLDATDTHQYRHAYFVNPVTGQWASWGNAPDMVQKYYAMAKSELANGHSDSRVGLFHLSLALHYLEDMGVPYHVGHDAAYSVASALYNPFCQDASKWCSAHDRYEADMVRGGSPIADLAANVNIDGQPIPQYGSPAGYATGLANFARGEGPYLTSAYGLLNGGTSAEKIAGEELLRTTTRRLVEHTATHATGLVLDLFQQLPDVQAHIVSVTPSGGNTIVRVQVSNFGQTDARNLVMRVLYLPCQVPATSFLGCEYVVDATAHATADILALTSQTLDITLSTLAKASGRILLVADALPLDGTLCLGGKVGCVLEKSEALGLAAASASYAPLPDLAIAPADLRVLPAGGQAVVTVHNTGAADAAAFAVRLYARDPASGTLSRVGEQAVPSGLPAGGSVAVPVTYTGALADPVARVDEAGAVAETDDVANNQAAVTTWTLTGATSNTGTTLRPGGDVTIASGGSLVLTSSSLLLAPGARLTVEPGGVLEMHGSTLAPATAGKPYLAAIHGTLFATQSTLAGAQGGLRVDGPATTITGSTLTSFAGGPALAVEGGNATLRQNTFLNGDGGGLQVEGGADVTSTLDQFTGNLATAIEARGGHLLLDHATVQGSPTALALSGGASVEANGTTLRPGVGLRAPASTVGVQNDGGVLVASGLTVAGADRALRGALGSMSLHGGSIAGTQLADASGSLVVSAHGATLSGTRSVTGAARVQADWPVTITAVSPAPDTMLVPDAHVDVRDATGALAWTGVADSGGRIVLDLPEFRQTAGVAGTLTPYTVTSRYNGPSVTDTLAATAPRDLTVHPPVLPDLLAVDVGPAYEGGQQELRAHVANQEPGRASNLVVRFLVDGAAVGDATVAILPGASHRDVVLPYALAPGVHSVQAVLDPANAIAETTEANN